MQKNQSTPEEWSEIIQKIPENKHGVTDEALLDFVTHYSQYHLFKTIFDNLRPKESNALIYSLQLKSAFYIHWHLAEKNTLSLDANQETASIILEKEDQFAAQFEQEIKPSISSTRASPKPAPQATRKLPFLPALDPIPTQPHEESPTSSNANESQTTTLSIRTTEEALQDPEGYPIGPKAESERNFDFFRAATETAKLPGAVEDIPRIEEATARTREVRSAFSPTDFFNSRQTPAASCWSWVTQCFGAKR